MTNTDPTDKTDTVYGKLSTSTEGRDKSNIRIFSAALAVLAGGCISALFLIWEIPYIKALNLNTLEVIMWGLIAGFHFEALLLFAGVFAETVKREPGPSVLQKKHISARFSFSVNLREAQQFWFGKKCPNCGIERL